MQEKADAGPSFLACSSDSVFQYLEDDSYGLSDNLNRAKVWADTMKTVISKTPLTKQTPYIIPLALDLPVWLLAPIFQALGLRTEPALGKLFTYSD